ncbi:MAG TPA: LuxR C-terminal-related transcriptional regulator [Steroidobacteraceae bacterium]|nr:LuxR C-terminal-related transcriptional regulator [Steroidobacteraceae bacterium]HUA23656.1 LuxR C-terminal-related transcriptional regulator [Steroidobacteraceae bacterium]
MSMVVSKSQESAKAPSHLCPLVFVVHADGSMRGSLERLIRGAGWRPEVFASAAGFLAHPRAAVPSCLVLDVHLPDMSGLELQKLVLDRAELQIIFVTGCGEVSEAVRAMKGGAFDFFSKGFAEEALLNAIRQAIGRSRGALVVEAQARVFESRYAALSQREREVMALVISGRLNKQIGAELGISEVTVKAHRGNVMRKMQARTLAELLYAGEKLGLARLPPEPPARPPERHPARFIERRPFHDAQQARSVTF